MRAVIFLAGFLAFESLAAQSDVFIDEGACPGEGCFYGETWIASRSAALRGEPDASAEVVTIVQAGQIVQTLTGQVHTVPGRFEVYRVHGEFSPGDEVFLYTYLGEGRFRLQHNGKVKEADLNFSPWGGSGATRCENDVRCWGSLQDDLDFDWWIKVKAESGEEGWIGNVSGFQTQEIH